MEHAQNAPTPATIFTLFYNGKFVTTDLSVCIEARLGKALGLWFCEMKIYQKLGLG